MTARFAHDTAIHSRFPALRVRTLVVHDLDRIDPVALDPAVHEDAARDRLVSATEGELPEIRAWRGAYGAMGLKPTQVRCAAEALLRRLRLEGSLPHVGPVVDLCNAISAAAAIPLAIFDLDHIAGDLDVTFAKGDELFATFSGAVETPETGEVIFRDAAGMAHARRWVHRQGAIAAVTLTTRRALMVAEAMHEGAEIDLARMAAVLTDRFRASGAKVEEIDHWEHRKKE